MTPADREAIRRRMTLAKDGPLSVRRELLYEDMPRLLAEVASLQGLLERQQEVIQTVIDALEFELLTPRDIWASHVMQAIDELRRAIPPSPQADSKS